MNKWKKVKTIEVYDCSGYYRIEKNEVITPGGKSGEYSVVRGAPFSIVIPIDKDGNIWMVKQHRYTIDKISLELPAGGLDGEKASTAAKRELEEETSLVSDDWKKLGIFYEANGLAEIEAHAFIAYNVKIINNPRRDPLDKNVFEVEKYSIAQVKKMIINNLLVDSPSISAFSMAFFKGEFGRYEKK